MSRHLGVCMILLSLIINSGLALCQSNVFQGEYQCVNKGKKLPSWIRIHYEKNETILFYFTGRTLGDYPSIGELYGRLKLEKKTGHLYYSSKDTVYNYSLKMKKVNGHLIVTENGVGPYGHGVYASGTYMRINSANPQFFLSNEGQKVFFNKTTPEKYNDDSGW